MKTSPWFFHPLFVLIFSTLALCASLFLYIYWYTRVNIELATVVGRLNIDSDQVFEARTWLVVLILSFLVTIILFGMFIIYVYHQKTLQLYRMQNNFINNFTHELKTPVTSLRLYLETFFKHDLPREKQLIYIRFMLRDVSRLSDQVHRILNLARIESKSYQGEFTVEDLAEATGEFRKAYHHNFEKARIRIHPPAEPLPPCRIARPLFEMMLMNLFTNGVTYNRSRPPEVEVRFEATETSVRIAVSDNGIGLEKGESKKIFRKFYQAGREESLSTRGSGLGLYLVQQIARIHGGQVRAESPGPGKGTTVWIALPAERRRG
jgi:two-component system, OmpR family, phosphate regulon sensor histidine kinase PhoR